MSLRVVIAFLLFHEHESSASSSGQISKIKTKPLAYPDIFIIGAQKCGTTSTAFLLLQHTDICNKGNDIRAYIHTVVTHPVINLSLLSTINLTL
jgi:hypothetical protein